MRHTAFRHLTAAILLAMTATAPAMAQSPVTDPGPATTSAPATEGVQAAPQPVTGEALPAAEDAATEETAIEEDAAMAATLPHDLSPIGMFMAADIVVKAVMTGLALASIATWTVWLVKSLELAAARRRVRRDLAMLDEARSLAEAVTGMDGQRGPAAALVRAAVAETRITREVTAGRPPASGAGLESRVASRLARIEARAGRMIARGTGILATIGSTAPFVGLFGTVWGIMNSFIGISESQTTNLAVVAPGIAEALLATAIGLVAAIPAVIIYNIFARAITGYRAELADASAAVARLVSRDLDRGGIAVVPAQTIGG